VNSLVALFSEGTFFVKEKKRMDNLEKELYALISSQGELVGSITHDLKGLISGLDGGLYLV